MKKLFLSAFFFFSAICFCFSQDTINSQIKEVILFSDQALVTRTAAANVKKGLNELNIELEVFNLDRDSIQALVFGKGEVYSVQVKEIYLKEEPQENIKALTKKIENLKDKKKSLNDERNVLMKKEEFLNSLLDFSKTQVPKDMQTSFPEIEDLDKTVTFLSEKYTDIINENEKLNLEIRELDKEIRVLEKELASLRRPSGKTKKVVEILFDSTKEQQVKIEASYLVYGALWNPFYKVDVALDLKDINLTMFSKINQRTGEDWENIKLSISNVVPLKGIGLPKLNSWILDLERHKAERRRGGFGKAMMMKEAMIADDVDQFSIESEEPAEFVSARRKELPLSFEYQLPQDISIESKDKDTILPVFSKDITGEFFYYSVPKENALTFLICETKADKELLNGNLNAYFGGRFVGKTYLTEKKAGEEFSLNLGGDREVKVKRKKIKDKIKETFLKQFQRKTIIRDLAFKIDIENLKDKQIKIKILDTIPVSKTDRIEVKNIKITPSPSQRDYQDKEGLNLWEFNLKPRGKKEINIEFTITYPKDIIISGL
jgi:uncharacterized protein (TIGR02231 family)